MKSNKKKASLFILGVIVTLAITWAWNKVFPTEPFIVKEMTDSITVVHKYNFGNQDSIDLEIQKKYKNLKLLNDYEEEIDRRIKRIDKK